MFIKKHRFTYPKIENNCINIGNLNLSGFDEAITHGILLIIRIGRSYNFYLPSLEDGDRFTGNVFSIFTSVKEYIYENGFLFIRQEINDYKGNWIIIEPNQFAWYLSRLTLSSRKESAPKIPYENNSNLKILDFKHSNGIFVKVNTLNYFIEYKYSHLEIMQLDGIMKNSNIFNSVILSYPLGERFFLDKVITSIYRKIQEIPHFCDDFSGYLCFCDSSCKLIKALKVGASVHTSKQLDYSYTVEFQEPIKNIKFIKQKNKKTSSDGNIPNFAVHIWFIETLEGELKYLLQGIGEYQFSLIIEKEDFKF